jgi:hypothetical protein
MNFDKVKELCQSKKPSSNSAFGFFPIISGCFICHAERSESICILMKNGFFKAFLLIQILSLRSE